MGECYKLQHHFQHLSCPSLHLLSNLLILHSKRGFPSFSFTSLCCLQSHRLNDDLELTSGGNLAMLFLKSYLMYSDKRREANSYEKEDCVCHSTITLPQHNEDMDRSVIMSQKTSPSCLVPVQMGCLCMWQL